jgi:kumamolisin
MAKFHNYIRRRIAGVRRSGSTTWTPATIAAEYKFPAGFTGVGQTIGIVELGGGISPGQFSNVTVVLVGSGTNTPDGPNGADGEVDLDIEMVQGIASGAAIRVYFGGNNIADFAACFAKAHADGCTIISCSWGGPENSYSASDIATMEEALQAANAAGISIFVAAGDNGSSDGESGTNVDYPASSVYVTGCGGTTLKANGTETVWNDGTQGGATGGGMSSLFSRPPYQAGIGLSGTNRAVPDVAGDADPNTGYTINVDGQSEIIGGTSAVAPLWAALTACLNQAWGKNAGPLNNVLYVLRPCPLNDITEGNNGAYVARNGYDCCTGLGSPNGAALLAALTTTPVPTPPAPTPTPPPTPTPVPPPAPAPSALTILAPDGSIAATFADGYSVQAESGSDGCGLAQGFATLKECKPRTVKIIVEAEA